MSDAAQKRGMVFWVAVLALFVLALIGISRLAYSGGFFVGSN